MKGKGAVAQLWRTLFGFQIGDVIRVKGNDLGSLGGKVGTIIFIRQKEHRFYGKYTIRIRKTSGMGNLFLDEPDMEWIGRNESYLKRREQGLEPK